MDNFIEINELLRKYKQSELAPDEIRKLLVYLQKGDNDTDLLKSLGEFWQHTENIPIKSEQIFNRIQNLLEKTNENNSVSKEKDLLTSLLPFLKYAAIIVFTVGFTWLAKDQFTGNEGKMVTRTLNDAGNEIHVPLGSKSKIYLPDGSIVNLNSGSFIKYPAAFNKSARTLYIDGEAFFDVKRNDNIPFFVKTKDITIKVLGTSFNVKSYEDERNIETTLISGKVEIYSNKKGISEKTRLFVMQPNQQAKFEKATGRITIVETVNLAGPDEMKPANENYMANKIYINPVIAWKDSRLVFRDEEFISLARKMERWYNVEIDIQNEEIAHALFSGVFEKETIEQALNAMKIAMPFNYKILKNKIIITK
jgi:ferric-dicitrate binding protein FerR (iron transport regulator)